MVQRHREQDALLTLLVHQRRGSNSVVDVDADLRVRAFLERPSPTERARLKSRWVNSGVYVCSAPLLDDLPAAPSDVARDLIPRALECGGVYAEPLDGFRCAVDSRERLEEARAAYSSGRWNSALRRRTPR
jgi:mannose-1-phosphate guanylyltransferase/phosphomannomutase